MIETDEQVDLETDVATEGEMPAVEDAPVQTEEGDAPADDAVEYVIAGEDPEPEQQQANERDWLKKLRADSRELNRLKREREAQQQFAAPALGKKPMPSDFFYDSDEYGKALDQWHEQKAIVDRAQAEHKARADAEAEAWNGTLRTYAQQKAEVAKTTPHFDELEATVNDRLSPAQQGVLLHVAGKRAEIVAALGASPKALSKLAGITDPLLLSAEIARMEANMSATPRKTPPPPERVVRGGGGNSGIASKSRLDDLKAKAEATGDSTEYWKALRAAKAKA